MDDMIADAGLLMLASGAFAVLLNVELPALTASSSRHARNLIYIKGRT